MKIRWMCKVYFDFCSSFQAVFDRFRSASIYLCNCLSIHPYLSIIYYLTYLYPPSQPSILSLKKKSLR
jgi:hypothetical protein